MKTASHPEQGSEPTRIASSKISHTLSLANSNRATPKFSNAATFNSPPLALAFPTLRKRTGATKCTFCRFGFSRPQPKCFTWHFTNEEKTERWAGTGVTPVW